MIEHLLLLYLRAVLQRSWNQLMFSTHAPAQMQAERLLDILSRNQDSVFGKEHGFEHIHSLGEFRERVPVRTYEEFEPYIARIKRGEKKILTLEDPELFGRTSGTTSEPKFIPITPAFYEEFSKTQKMWQRKLLADHRRMARGKILSVMGAEIDDYTECGIPFGAMSGHSYRMQYPLTQRMYAAPYDVMCLKDFEAKYYLILRLGLEQNVTTIAALNPSTILLLMKKLNSNAPELAKDIADGNIRSDLSIPPRLRKQLQSRLRPNRQKAREIEMLIGKRGVIKGTDIWKELAVITTWQGGSVGFYVNQFPAYFPGVPIRDMGLVATEGYVSIPLWSNTPKGLLGITGHFFEFFEMNKDGGRSSHAVGCEEVEAGKNYYVVLTTSGGLYRYDICDIVEVVEFYNKTPVIVFKQKGGNTVSITGEKLTEAQVTAAMRQAAAALPAPIEGFVLILQLDEPPFYKLFVETPEQDERMLQRLLANFERELRLQNVEYAGKRDSQRLGEPALCLVQSGCFERRRKSCVHAGAPDAQYKFPHLLPAIEKLGEVGPVTEIKLGAAAVQRINT